jgi:hypothetical protein
VDERTSKSIKKTNEAQSKAQKIGLGRYHLCSGPKGPTPTKVYHWMQFLQVDVIFNWMEPFILEAFIFFVDERTSKSITKQSQKHWVR